jgi:hypothetical protein
MLKAFFLCYNYFGDDMEKNRKLLLISSILMIVYLIPNILVSIFVGIGNNTFIKVFNISMYVLSVIGIVIFMYYTFSKKNIHRGLEFFISIIFFCMNIVSGVLGFIYFNKTSTYKKRELPKLEIQYNHKKIVYILAFLLSMVLMFIVPIFIKNKIVDIAIDASVFIMMILLFYKDLKRDFKAFKEYFREYNSFVWKMFGISIAVMFVLAISIKLYTGINSPTNQVKLLEMFRVKPLYIIFLAMIYAPITEELLFRGIIRKVFNNKYLFIIISGVLFGALHVVDDFQSISELLYILVYSSLGIFMASTYYKTNNLFTDIYFHFIQNTLAVLAMILLSLLGI